MRCEGVSIFRLRLVEEVGLDSGWVEAGYETHRVPSYDLDTPSDALENQIGPSVWPLQCFEGVKFCSRIIFDPIKVLKTGIPQISIF